MSFKRDRYLVLDPCGNYLVRIAIPSYMRHLFQGKRYFMKSTGTRDIRQARLFRDAIALEWTRLRNLLKPPMNRTPPYTEASVTKQEKTALNMARFIRGQTLTLLEKLNELDADEQADICESLHDHADELYRSCLARFGDDGENR